MNKARLPKAGSPLWLLLLASAQAQIANTPGDTAPAPGPPPAPTTGQPVTPRPDQANSATYPSGATRSDSISSAQKSAQRTATAARGAGPVALGMQVQGKEGEKVGTVADIVRNDRGVPAYVVIADQTGSDTAIPFAAARGMIQGNKVVIDSKRLQDAPKVASSQLQSKADQQWRSQADRYWSQHPEAQ